MSILSRFQQDERGNIAILAAILLPIATAAVGAAVTYAKANSTRTNMQAALDAAVLAGVLASEASDDPIATAQNVFQANIGPFATASSASLSAAFTATTDTVTGTGSGSVVNPFSGLIGPDMVPVGVAGSAAIRTYLPICVLGLNGLDNGSFDINGSAASFNAGCAVQANTTSSTGMTMEGAPTAVATAFGVRGGHKGDGFSPTPTDHAPNVPDPYASLPFPAYDDCSSGHGNNYTQINSDTTLLPGTYCGGIHIYGNGTKVTMLPGIYVMVSGPFWVDASSVVTGDQVMIAFTGTGAALQVWGSSSVTLTSPTTGIYKNIQFFQDPNDPSSRGAWDSIGGGSGGTPKLQYDGVAYFPTQNFWAFGNATVLANSPTLAIVADKIWTQGSASVTITHNNPRNLTVSSTAQIATGAKLIN